MYRVGDQYDNILWLNFLLSYQLHNARMQSSCLPVQGWMAEKLDVLELKYFKERWLMSYHRALTLAEVAQLPR
jgi:hypothetical protein